MAIVVMPISLAGQETADPFSPVRQAIARGDGISAEAELRRLLDQGLPRPQVAALMGEAQIQQGDLAEARKWLGHGDFTDDSRGLGFQMLGRLNLLEGDLTAASAAFDEALRVTPNDAGLWVEIGRMRYRNGAQSAALAAGIYALELDPNSAAALHFRAQLLRDAAGPAVAIWWFEAALQRNPDDLKLMGDYAATLGELGRAKEMLVQTRRMIEIDPKNEQAFYLQAVLAARTGNDSLAQRLLWLTSDAFRETPAALLLSGCIDLRSSNPRNAVQTFDRLARMQPDNLRVRLLLARALSLGGLNGELVRRFGGYASRPDAPAYLLTLMGRAHEALGERDAAAGYLDRAALPGSRLLVTFDTGTPLEVSEGRWELEPTDAQRTSELVRQLAAAGQGKRAAEIANQYLVDQPGSVDGFTLAGDANLVAGDLHGGLLRYRQAAKVRRSFSLVRRMVFAYRGLQQREDALALVSEYLSANPLDGQAAALAAEFAAEQGDFRRADLLLAHAAKQAGGNADPLILGQSALVALKLGQYDRAVRLARQAYALQPAHPATAFALARCLDAAGGNNGQIGALLVAASAEIHKR